MTLAFWGLGAEHIGVEGFMFFQCRSCGLRVSWLGLG